MLINNGEPLRYSNSFLKRFADELEHNIKVKLKYQHMTDMKDELLLELVRRELDRAEQPKGGGEDHESNDL